MSKHSRRKLRQELGQYSSHQRIRLRGTYIQQDSSFPKSQIIQKETGNHGVSPALSKELLDNAPDIYRKQRGFGTSLWDTSQQKAIDVQRPFLRGKRAIHGRWGVSRPMSGKIVARFDDYVQAQALIIRINRLLRRLDFPISMWYFLTEIRENG